MPRRREPRHARLPSREAAFRSTIEEARRLRRVPARDRVLRPLLRVLPRRWWEEYRSLSGYVLLERGDTARA